MSKGTTNTRSRVPRTTSGSHAWNDVIGILGEFRAARTELDASATVFTAEYQRNADLLREATRHAETFGTTGDEATKAQLWLNERSNEIPQRSEYRAALERSTLARSVITDLRRKLQLPLSRLAIRNPDAAAALLRIDRISDRSLADNVDMIIGLLEELTSKVRRPARRVSETDRARIRAKWFDQKKGDKSWKEITASGAPAYNTIHRWLSAKDSSRDPYVRGKLAKAFRCSLQEVPK